MWWWLSLFASNLWMPSVKINEPLNQAGAVLRSPLCPCGMIDGKGFKELQTTVWSAISKVRASLRAGSIRPETQQRAAEQILQSTRCKNGSLKCQSLISFIWTAPRASCLSAKPQNGSEKRKGILYRVRSSANTGWAQDYNKENKTLLDAICFHSLSGNCPDPFYEFSF